jgi:hypothetical protein
MPNPKIDVTNEDVDDMLYNIMLKILELLTPF